MCLCHHLTLLSEWGCSHRWYISEWAWLCSNKILFIKTGSRLDLALNCNFSSPGMARSQVFISTFHVLFSCSSHIFFHQISVQYLWCALHSVWLWRWKDKSDRIFRRALYIQYLLEFSFKLGDLLFYLIFHMVLI